MAEEYIHEPKLDEDEMAAIATALYIYLQDQPEQILLTEVPAIQHYNPWPITSRVNQSNRFIKWQAQKR